MLETNLYGVTHHQVAVTNVAQEVECDMNRP